MVSFEGFVDKQDLIANLMSADSAVIALVKNIETDLVLTLKMFDYISLGIPTIITRTRSVEAYLKEDEVYFFNSGNIEELATALVDLYTHPEKRQTLTQKASEVYENYKPAKQKANLVQMIHALTASESPAESTPVQSGR